MISVEKVQEKMRSALPIHFWPYIDEMGPMIAHAIASRRIASLTIRVGDVDVPLPGTVIHPVGGRRRYVVLSVTPHGGIVASAMTGGRSGSHADVSFSAMPTYTLDDNQALDWDRSHEYEAMNRLGIYSRAVGTTAERLAASKAAAIERLSALQIERPPQAAARAAQRSTVPMNSVLARRILSLPRGPVSYMNSYDDNSVRRMLEPIEYVAMIERDVRPGWSIYRNGDEYVIGPGGGNIQYRVKVSDVAEEVVKPRPPTTPSMPRQRPVAHPDANPDRLREIGEHLIEGAEAESARPRVANTARRARMAASAEANASTKKSIGQTLVRIAEAIETGTAGDVGKVRSKAEVEDLRLAILRAQPYRERDRGEPVRDEHLDSVAYPWPSLNLSHLRTALDILARSGGAAKSAKMLRGAMLRYGPSDHSLDARDHAEAEALFDVVAAAKKYDDRAMRFAEIWNGREYRLAQRIGIDDAARWRKFLKDYRRIAYTREGAADPTRALMRSLIGVKIPGYFPTPSPLADHVVDLADLRPGMSVLEPSAGSGAIADAVRRTGVPVRLVVIEKNDTLRSVLTHKTYDLVDRDFLGHHRKYDRIVMNPPFEDNQDVEHLRHAYDLLEPGGVVVSIVGEGPFFRQGRTESQFREWLLERGAFVEKNPDGAFKSSDRPTGVASRIVKIVKPS